MSEQVTKTQVKLRLFGTPKIQLGQRDYPLTEGYPTYILVFLCLKQDWVSLESLANQFYETNTRQAKNNIREPLSKINGTLMGLKLNPIEMSEDKTSLRLRLPNDFALFNVLCDKNMWNKAYACARKPFLGDYSLDKYRIDNPPMILEELVYLRQRLFDRWKEVGMYYARALVENDNQATAHRVLSELIEADPDDHALKMQKLAFRLKFDSDTLIQQMQQSGLSDEMIQAVLELA